MTGINASDVHQSPLTSFFFLISHFKCSLAFLTIVNCDVIMQVCHIVSQLMYDSVHTYQKYLQDITINTIAKNSTSRISNGPACY